MSADVAATGSANGSPAGATTTTTATPCGSSLCAPSAFDDASPGSPLVGNDDERRLLTPKKSLVFGKKKKVLKAGDKETEWLTSQSTIPASVLIEVKFAGALLAGVKRRRAAKAGTGVRFAADIQDVVSEGASPCTPAPAANDLEKSLASLSRDLGMVGSDASRSDPTHGVTFGEVVEETEVTSDDGKGEKDVDGGKADGGGGGGGGLGDTSITKSMRDLMSFLTPAELEQQKKLLEAAREVQATKEKDQPPPVVGGKGLENQTGQNNCFLNTVLQALWHCPSFKENFISAGKEHKCSEGLDVDPQFADLPTTCLFCAIMELFAEYASSKNSVLPPHIVRKVLAWIFAGEERFQMGHMEDVVECFEAILYRLHLTANSSVDSCNPSCFVHRTFSLTVAEKKSFCCQPCDKAKAGVNPFVYAAPVHYFPSNLFTQECPKSHHTSCTHVETCMHHHLCGEPFSCEANSSVRKAFKKPHVLEIPDVFVLGVSWLSERESNETIAKFAAGVPETLTLSDIFHIPGYGQESGADGPAVSLCATLIGMCCFYGKHYTCYCYSEMAKKWLFFDDGNVREVGDLQDVRDTVVASRQQPVMMFYSYMETGVDLTATAKARGASPPPAKSVAKTPTSATTTTKTSPKGTQQSSAAKKAPAGAKDDDGCSMM